MRYEYTVLASSPIFERAVDVCQYTRGSALAHLGAGLWAPCDITNTPQLNSYARLLLQHQR